MTATQPILFHATLREFSLGETVKASTLGEFYPDAVALLESVKPDDRPSRSVCVFASDNPVALTRFLIGQRVNVADIKLYRVEMDSYHKAPFRIAHELDKRIKASGKVDALVREYWNPQRDWVFWEYFGPSFRVIDHAPPVNQIDIYAFDLKYDKDIKLSKSI